MAHHPSREDAKERREKDKLNTCRTAVLASAGGAMS
jgi:hypothetical protein